MFSLANAELVATYDEATDVNSEYDGITRSLYVTESRALMLVESFFSFDGRPAISTKPVSLDQARTWCIACGLHERTVDRYLERLPQADGAPRATPSLTQIWGIDTTADRKTT